jgi:hypothetical protein
MITLMMKLEIRGLTVIRSLLTTVGSETGRWPIGSYMG